MAKICTCNLLSELWKIPKLVLQERGWAHNAVQKCAELLCWWSWFASTPRDNSVLSTLLVRELMNMKGIFAGFFCGVSPPAKKYTPSCLQFYSHACLEVRQASNFMSHRLTSWIFGSHSSDVWEFESRKTQTLISFFYRITISFTFYLTKCYLLSSLESKALKEIEIWTVIFRGPNVQIKQLKDRVIYKEAK